MRTAMIAASFALIACGAARAQQVQSPAEEQRIVALTAADQARILHALPLAGPDSADEPKAIDLSGAAVTFTYWAPNFVISIITNRDPLIAVRSRLDFPPKGVRVADPRKLPIMTTWTTSDHCPAIQAALQSLSGVVRRFVVPRTAPPRAPPAQQFDGAGYMVRIEGDFSVGAAKGGDLTLSGQEATPVGQWAIQTRDSLKACWYTNE